LQCYPGRQAAGGWTLASAPVLPPDSRTRIVLSPGSSRQKTDPTATVPYRLAPERNLTDLRRGWVSTTSICPGATDAPPPAVSAISSPEVTFSRTGLVRVPEPLTISSRGQEGQRPELVTVAPPPEPPEP